MNTQKINTSLILSLFIFSFFSLIYGSEAKKPGMLDGIKITKNKTTPPQPACMDGTSVPNNPSVREVTTNTPPAELTDKEKEEAAKITAYLAERAHQATEFDTVPEISSNRLGDAYPQAKLPDQVSTIRVSSQGWTESNLAYILRLIKNGQFEQARSSNPQIFELLGQALKDSAIAFSAKQDEQQKQTHATLEQQRPDFQTTTEHVDLITQASFKLCEKGSIVPVRIQEILVILEKEQRKLESETNKTMQELANREKRIKELRSNIRELHSTADKLRPISPERIFTIQQSK